MTDMYSVRIEAQAPAGVLGHDADDAADDFMDLLADHSGVVAVGDRSWSAAVSIMAADVCSAAAQGAKLVTMMATKAGMPSWPFIRAEAVLQDVLEAENERPTMPEIVSVPEAADILGVSQQRVRELAATQDRFPQPVYELRTGKLWLRSAIEAFGSRPRKPGRPSRQS